MKNIPSQPLPSKLRRLVSAPAPLATARAKSSMSAVALAAAASVMGLMPSASSAAATGPITPAVSTSAPVQAPMPTLGAANLAAAPALVRAEVPRMYVKVRRCSRTSRRCRTLYYERTNTGWSPHYRIVGTRTQWTWSWNP